MKRTTKRLMLSPETIRRLTPDQLVRVAGGIPPNYTDNCTRYCSDNCVPGPSDDCIITEGCYTFGPECIGGRL